MRTTIVSSLLAYLAGHVLAATPDGYSYIGCIPGNGYNGNVVTPDAISNDGMTLELCALVCIGRDYFAVSSGSTCMCGDTIAIGEDFWNAEGCTIPCNGNTRAGRPVNDQICGSNEYSNVYLKDIGTVPDFPSSPNYNSMGCYSVIANNEHILGEKTVALPESALTIELCEGICRGFKYYSLGPSVCVCGDQVNTAARIAATDLCSEQCPGNNQEICGGTGGSYVSLYATPEFADCGRLDTPLRVRNPGFESGVISWTSAGVGNIRWNSVVSSDTFSGRRVARIANKGGAQLVLKQELRLCPGASYIFSFAVRGNDCQTVAAFKQNTLYTTIRSPYWGSYIVYLNSDSEYGDLSFTVTCDNLPAPLSQYFIDAIQVRPASSADSALFPP